MKCGGVSWNRSENHKAGVTENHKCRFCGRQYKMSWCKENHENLCKEHKH